MPEGKRLYFFIHPSEWPSILESIETSQPLKYVLKKAYKEPELSIFSSWKEIPAFGISTWGNWLHDPRFLVLTQDSGIILRSVKLNAGGTHWFCDQPENIDSVNLSFGGIYESDKSFIAGELTTISKSRTSLLIFDEFARRIRKATRVAGSFRVTPKAVDCYKAGYRLTTDVNTPIEYDLLIESEMRR